MREMSVQLCRESVTISTCITGVLQNRTQKVQHTLYAQGGEWTTKDSLQGFQSRRTTLFSLLYMQLILAKTKPFFFLVLLWLNWINIEQELTLNKQQIQAVPLGRPFL